MKRNIIIGVVLAILLGFAYYRWSTRPPSYVRPKSVQLDVPVENFKLTLNQQSCTDESTAPVVQESAQLTVEGSFTYLSDQIAPEVVHIEFIAEDERNGKEVKMGGGLARDVQQDGRCVKFSGTAQAPGSVVDAVVVINDLHNVRVGVGYITTVEKKPGD